jgi:hypothetical protein
VVRPSAGVGVDEKEVHRVRSDVQDSEPHCADTTGSIRPGSPGILSAARASTDRAGAVAP